MNITEEQSFNISADMEYVLRYHAPSVKINIFIDVGSDIQRRYYQVHWKFKYNTFISCHSSDRKGFFNYGLLFNINYTLSHLGEYAGFGIDE